MYLECCDGKTVLHVIEGGLMNDSNESEVFMTNYNKIIDIYRWVTHKRVGESMLTEVFQLNLMVDTSIGVFIDDALHIVPTIDNDPWTLTRQYNHYAVGLDDTLMMRGYV